MSPGFETLLFANQSSGADVEALKTLQAENEQLRNQLAQLASASRNEEETLNREQSLQLVSRLEQVLDELKRSDARATEMNDQLNVANKALEDEQEEREHIEKWLTQLEDRVTQHESKAQAEGEELKSRLDQARSIQEKSNECLTNLISTKTGDAGTIPVELAQSLTTHIESLQAQLNLAQDETASLRQQLENGSSDSENETQSQDSEQDLAVMQLEISQQRAEISRQRMEFDQLKSQFEKQLDEVGCQNESNAAVQATREQLDQLQKNDDAADGNLANRISNLLQRVTVDQE